MGVSRRRLGVLASLALLAIVAGGCRPDGGKEPDVDAGPTVEVSDADLKAVVDGNNAFALDLYKKLAEKEAGNILFSPYSISSALAMTYAGARGQTAEQMAKTMHFTLPPERFHPAVGMLDWKIRSADKGQGYEVRSANALWPQRGRQLVPEFLDITRQHYRAGVREVDYARDAEAARRTINGWVEERTKGRIGELLARENVGPATQMVLTNAICFDGEWEYPFVESETVSQRFDPAPGRSVNVPMMHHRTGKFRYHLGPEFHLAELPYRGGRAELLILLPAKRHGLQELEKSLTVEKLQVGIAKLSERVNELWLPRFEFRTRIQPATILSEMGMPVPFSDNADFSGITPNCPPITDIVHAAYVRVDERGTAAAAATAVAMAISLRLDPVIFRADQPFLLLIRHPGTGCLLFVARVSEPSNGQ